MDYDALMYQITNNLKNITEHQGNQFNHSLTMIFADYVMDYDI